MGGMVQVPHPESIFRQKRLPAALRLIGDNSADDFAALNTELSGSGLFPRHAVLNEPSVAYKTSDTLVIPEGGKLAGLVVPTFNNYWLYDEDGTLPKCCVIRPTGDVRAAIAPTATARGCAIENLIIDMGAVTASGTGSITAATAADPVVITSAAHGLNNGDAITITGVVGMTELNDITYIVANVTTNTFELKNVDGSGFTAYASGGTWTLNPVGLLVDGLWHSTFKNIFIINLQDDNTIGVLEIGTDQTPAWLTFENVKVFGDYSVTGGTWNKKGIGWKIQGNASPPPRANQSVKINCRTHNVNDGTLLDRAGSGQTFINHTSEVNGNDGVRITNNTTEGYPVFLGGEFSGNTGTGVDGVCLLHGAAIAGNGTATANGAALFDQDATGAVSLSAAFLPDLLGDSYGAQTLTAASQAITPSASTLVVKGDAPYVLSSTQIDDGSFRGQRLRLIGGDDTNYLVFSDGNNINLKSDRLALLEGEELELEWFDSVGVSGLNNTWVEVSRNVYQQTANLSSAAAIKPNRRIVHMTTGGSGKTVTLPPAAHCDGLYRFMKVDSGIGSFTIAGNGAETINGAASIGLSTQYADALLYSDGSNWYRYSGV